MTGCPAGGVWDILSGPVRVSLQVSAISTLIASCPGIAAGVVLAQESFPGRKALVTCLYTALAFPTVVIGLFVYAMLSRSGPMGAWGLLYSRTAMVIGQVILVAPIIATFTLSAVRRVDPMLVLAARSLGAGRFRLYGTVLKEARYGVIAAVAAAFGRAVSEVGVSMILGGNIRGVTRTMTTMIALEHDKGRFDVALALGGILLVITLGINILFHRYQSAAEDADA